MNITGKTIKQIIEENNLCEAEIKWLERVITMMMTIKKHMVLKEKYVEQKKFHS